MKKIIGILTLAFGLLTSVFAQNDLQPLAIVKLNKSETITLKALKQRIDAYQKQNGVASFTIEQKREILNAIIDEKLVVQAAAKAGLQVTDSQVNQYFMQNIGAQIGRSITEAEFAEVIKQNTGKSLDEYMKEQVGMGVSDYKAYLKNQLIAQQYVLSQKQAELAKVAPTDQEIRAFYELNKASFVQNDMLKLFLVLVPKASAEDSKAKSFANKMYNDLKDKKTTADSLKNQMIKEEGKNFQAGDIIIAKTAQHAQQLGISYNNLLELFEKNKGFFSDLNESADNIQFYTLVDKYSAKMLALSDIVQPDTTVTVYDYIKENLTQQKQGEYLINAINEITKQLDTPANVDRKKTGSDLDKLLNW